jgi:hypothetical protein
MHLPAAFQFALKIGKFFALTAFNNLNLISQQRCDTKNETISGRTQNYALFGKLFLKSFKSHDPIPLRPILCSEQ